MNRTTTTFLALVMCAGVKICSAATTYAFQSFEACPGCSTQTGGINDAGIAGVLTPGQGYIYDMKTRVATPVPGAIAITVPGNYGRIPGATLGPDGTVLPLIREADGTTHSVPGYPGAAFTFLLELNQSGAGVGYASLDFNSFFSLFAHTCGCLYPAGLPRSASLRDVRTWF